MGHGGIVSSCHSRPKKKGRAIDTTLFIFLLLAGLALAGFEPALRLVDHIDAALAAHDAAIAMALLERAEGVAYLHGPFLHVAARGLRLGLQFGPEGPANIMVDDTGIEPVTPSMSTQCSTAELIIHVQCVSPAL